MENRANVGRRHAKAIAAVLLVAGLGWFARQPALSEAERTDLAARFRFDKLPLPELPGLLQKKERVVHPSLKNISAWVSAVGAAVALHDLDGDGLPNDLSYVDTRMDRVIVAPTPGTSARYKPFALTAEPLPYDSHSMAPMGCLPGDFNEDGRTDILVYYWGRSPVLFLRRQVPQGLSGSALTRADFDAQELVEPYQDWYTNAATQADLDGDGHLDLIICNYYSDGSRILDVSAPGTVEMQHSMSRAYNGGRNRLFVWDPARSGSQSVTCFREAEGMLDDEIACGWTLAVGAADLDGDMLPEIYFVNDFGPDRLLHNRSKPGQLRFALLQGERSLTTPRSKVLGDDSFKGMGIDFGDLNGDGWPDIYISNIAGPFALLESHFVFMSTGQVADMRDGVAPYRDASEELGLSRSGWAWESRLADFDNDGVLEAMQGCGFLKGSINRWPELQELATSNDGLLSNPYHWPHFRPGDDLSGGDHNPFFVRAADGRYYDIAADLGLAQPMVTRGIATADVYGDGKMHFAVANQWGPSFFFKNSSPNAGAFLGLNLRLAVGEQAPGATVVRSGRPPLEKGKPSRPAVGATAKIYLPDGRILVGQVDGGTGHSGKRSQDLHFGLGHLSPDTCLRVDLRWRDTAGRLHAQTLYLSPGWHTVLLGPESKEEKGGNP